MRKILEKITEVVTGRKCKDCYWCNGYLCTIDSLRYEECVSSIFPKHFLKKEKEDDSTL